VDHTGYLLRLAELELIQREGRMVERRIKQARFPAVKSLGSFDFLAIPSLNQPLVLELARCEYVERRENITALGNSGTGKIHVVLGLGMSACQQGLSEGFTTASALVHELMEARDERRLLQVQKRLAGLARDIADDMVQLEIHLGQSFLHMLNMRSGHLDQAVPVAQQGTHRPDGLRGMKGAPQQSHRVQVLQPLAVGHVALAPGDILHMPGVDQTDFHTSLLQDLEQRNPVDPRGLHGHRANITLL
jgi:hypothetical protein